MKTQDDPNVAVALISKVQTFRDAARHCAMCMLENAAYIQKEQANVRISDEMCRKISELCSSMIGTKHDVINELFELDDLLAQGATTSRILQKIDMIIRWMVNDIRPLHSIVMTLQNESEQDNTFARAYLLVAESAVNILQAIAQTSMTAQACSE